MRATYLCVADVTGGEPAGLALQAHLGTADPGGSMRPIIGVVVGLTLVRWPPASQAQPDADNLVNLGPHT